MQTKFISSYTWKKRDPFPYGTRHTRNDARKKVVVRTGENSWMVRGENEHPVTFSKFPEPHYTCECPGLPGSKTGHCSHIIAVMMFEGVIE